MTRIKVWDPLVRLFHWSLVIGFTLNMTVLEEDGKAHEQVGYIVLALVTLRILWGFVGTRNARFSAFPPSLRAAIGHLEGIARGIPDRAVSHNPLGALMVYNLLATMIALGLTGWLMTRGANPGESWVSELHEVIASWAVFSVVAHVFAVIYESRRSHVNLVKAMITGTKEFTDDGQTP